MCGPTLVIKARNGLKPGKLRVCHIGKWLEGPLRINPLIYKGFSTIPDGCLICLAFLPSTVVLWLNDSCGSFAKIGVYTPKWMISNGNLIKMDDLGGKPTI